MPAFRYLDSNVPARFKCAGRAPVAQLDRALPSEGRGQGFDAYPGPVLPGSTAPGIVEIREDFRAELRQALLQTSRADPLFAFAQTPEGWDDVELWERCLALLPRASSRRTTVIARLRRLEAEDPVLSRRDLWVPPSRATYLQRRAT